MSNTPRDEIRLSFDRELSGAPVPPGLRDQAVHAATSAPRGGGASRAPQLLAMVAALLAIALVATLVAGNRLLRSTPGVGLPRASVSRTASPTPLPSASALATPTETAVTAGGGTAPAAGSWQKLAPLPVPMARFTATVLVDGKVLIAGGEVSTETGGFATAKAYIFDPASGTYTATGPMAIARAGHIAAPLPSGKILVAGGYTQGGYAALRTVEIYDPASGSWSTAAPMQYGRTHHAAVGLNGKVLVIGGGAYPPVGISAHGAAPATLPSELYDPATDSWSNAGTPRWDRPVSPTATVLKDGRVLVIGGQYMSDSPDEAVETSEIYDPRSNTWSPATPETRIGARQFHTATRLPNGKVLIAGGMIDQHPTSSAALYDPATNSWSQLPNMNDNRCGASAQLLPNGRVLVAGGGCQWGDQSGTADEFDPASNRWFPVAGLPTPRGTMEMVFQPDGSAVAMGGILGSGVLTNAVERFRW